MSRSLNHPRKRVENEKPKCIVILSVAKELAQGFTKACREILRCTQNDSSLTDIMPQISTILQDEQQNNGSYIRLYAEGIFYKAYERSAWVACRVLHPFMVKKRAVRKVFGSQRFLFRYGYISNGLLTFKVRKH